MSKQRKTAIVTGASSGIGLSLVKRLLAEDWSVVATARTASKTPELQQHPTDRLIVIDGDIGHPATGQEVARAAVSFNGQIDLLVNNAGIFVPNAMEDYTPEQFDRVVATNMAGFFYATQPVLKPMKAARTGHIVTISTTLAVQPVAGLNAVLTSLTKGGLNSATQALALELVGNGIRVNAIGAGIIDTPMHKPEAHAYLRGLHPMGRLGTSEEIIDAIFYLQSAHFVTGEVLHVDGGAHAGKW